MNLETWQQLKPLFHAALELGTAERTSFLREACAGNEQLRQGVEKLLASHDNAGSFLLSPAVMDEGVITALDEVETSGDNDRVGQRIGPYEILREIGHGGMGTVFLAVRADDQYRKEVAIKLVNRGMDTDTILRRFMMERQILANLEHPNIARLLEGGTTEDGLPYFVMEYVEGEPIDEYCEARQFAVAERLALFRQVCAALQYAHQHLVVHRDIKPRNILVTADGVPKLLDFGIAKLLSPDWDAETGEVTASMQLLMTPAYASPEQLRGLAITTASDIYSLGVVLYELLSGQRPYRVSSRLPEEMAQAILREEPERPSDAISDFGFRISESKAKTPLTSRVEQGAQTNPKSEIRNPKSLRGDLDNIVLKALRKEPQRRYASVQEFSEDIRRHLDGLPVTASPDTFAYRSGKFIQRNKAGVLAAAVVLITLLSATVITTWEARVARSERDKAERRFTQVRKLASSVLFEYHDAVEKLPGSTPLRQKMLKDALEYLDNLSSDSGGDPALQGELATAYEKIGDVQGNPFRANLGNQDGALESYRKALTIREALYAANRADAKRRLELGNSYRSVADIFWAKGENEGALSNYRKALATLEGLVQADPKNQQYLTNINLVLNGIAHVQTQSDDFKGALDTYHQCLANAEALLATDATDKQNFRKVAVAHLKVGDALMDVTDYAGALPQYEKSVEGFSEIAASGQNDAAAARLLGLSYARIASIHRHLEQYEKAVEFHLKAIEQQKQAAAADPDNVQIHFDIAATYGNLGDNYLQMKKLDNAAVNVREAIRIYTETLARNPDYSQGQGGLGNTYVTYAEVLLARGDANGALENYRKALAIFELEPVRSAQPIALANVYQGMGNVHLFRANQARGQTRQQAEYFKQAKDWYQKSLDVLHTLEEQGKVTGEDKTTSDEITKKIEQCRVALTKLKASP